MTETPAPDPNQGPLVPSTDEGTVIIESPPEAPLHMTPEQADISGIRLLDAADHARNNPHERRKP